MSDTGIWRSADTEEKKTRWLTNFFLPHFQLHMLLNCNFLLLEKWSNNPHSPCSVTSSLQTLLVKLFCVPFYYLKWRFSGTAGFSLLFLRFRRRSGSGDIWQALCMCLLGVARVLTSTLIITDSVSKPLLSSGWRLEKFSCSSTHQRWHVA